MKYILVLCFISLVSIGKGQSNDYKREYWYKKFDSLGRVADTLLKYKKFDEMLVLPILEAEDSAIKYNELCRQDLHEEVIQLDEILHLKMFCEMIQLLHVDSSADKELHINFPFLNK